MNTLSLPIKTAVLAAFMFVFTFHIGLGIIDNYTTENAIVNAQINKAILQAAAI
jgi:hypothetical protein